MPDNNRHVTNTWLLAVSDTDIGARLSRSVRNDYPPNNVWSTSVIGAGDVITYRSPGSVSSLLEDSGEEMGRDSARTRVKPERLRDGRRYPAVLRRKISRYR